MATLLLALAATLFGPLGTLSGAQATIMCPGGKDSGSGNASCPNLYNTDLRPQRSFPATLYRGDSRRPDEIFRDGFNSRGANDNLPSHVHGDPQENSNYISTTGTQTVAETFARSQGLRNLDSEMNHSTCLAGGSENGWLNFPGIGGLNLGSCDHGLIAADSYVYVIDPGYARNALYVPDQVAGTDLARYASQDEWAYVHHIPREAIVGVRVYRMTGRMVLPSSANRGANAYIDPRSITFAYRHFFGNPYHAAHRVNYDPDHDPNSNFTWQSWLGIVAPPSRPPL
jgi:hypothetical protein